MHPGDVELRLLQHFAPQRPLQLFHHGRGNHLARLTCHDTAKRLVDKLTQRFPRKRYPLQIGRTQRLFDHMRMLCGFECLSQSVRYRTPECDTRPAYFACRTVLNSAHSPDNGTPAREL